MLYTKILIPNFRTKLREWLFMFLSKIQKMKNVYKNYKNQLIFNLLGWTNWYPKNRQPRGQSYFSLFSQIGSDGWLALVSIICYFIAFCVTLPSRKDIKVFILKLQTFIYISNFLYLEKPTKFFKATRPNFKFDCFDNLPRFDQRNASLWLVWI